jgi:hypothetical protein
MFGRTARACAGVMPPGSVVVVSAMCSCCVGSLCESSLPLCRTCRCLCRSDHPTTRVCTACSRRRSERHMRRIAAADHQLGIALQVALSVQHRRPPSLTSAFSLSPRRTTLTIHRTTKIHEYCELFMIIRRHSIQSHDNLGADVFKLMIISVCCIQTQLIVFMPHAGCFLACVGACV